MSQKKNPIIESLLKSHFVGLLSIIESILCLESLLEMLLRWIVESNFIIMLAIYATDCFVLRMILKC